jgi:hypothetical protein
MTRLGGRVPPFFMRGWTRSYGALSPALLLSLPAGEGDASTNGFL